MQLGIVYSSQRLRFQS